MWQIEQKTESPDTLQIYIYGDVEGDSYDWWTDEVIESETSANHFRNELAKYPNVSNIDVFINSNGGSVFEGTAIYNQLKRHKAYKTVYIDGFACSIASVIAMCGDKVVMPRNAMMMIHNAWMYVAGNASELRKAAEDLDQINKGNRQAYLQKAGDKLAETKLIELLDKESYLTAEECLAYGLADEYAEKEADISKMEKMLQKQNLHIQQQLKVRQSLVNQLVQLRQQEVKPKEISQEPVQNKSLYFLFEKI